MGRQVWTNNIARWEPCLIGLTDALCRQEKYAEAGPLCLELVTNSASLTFTGDETSVKRALNVAKILGHWGWAQRNTTARPAALLCAREAIRLFRACLAVWSKSDAPNNLRIADARERLAGSLVAEAVLDPALMPADCDARFAESEQLLRANLESPTTGNSNQPALRPTYVTFLRLYEAWEAAAPNTGKAAEAARWQHALGEFDQAAAKAKANASASNSESQPSRK
jgi:hypothetical protein